MFDIRTLNISIELWGAAFCVIGIMCLVLFGRPIERYRALIGAGFASGFISSCGDALAGFFRGGTGDLAWAMTHIGNNANYIANFILIAILTAYLCARIKDAGGASYRPWLIGVCVSSAVMCTLTLLGVFFYIDDNNFYHRSDWYWVASVYAAFVFIINAAITLVNRRLLGNQAFGCLLFYSVAPALAMGVQIVVYGLNFASLAVALSLAVVLVEMQARSSEALIEQAEELAQTRIEVSDSRIKVMVSQIQPHFLFNTLDTIYGLCDEDKELAKEAIASFSRYLRTNLDSLSRSTPVPIETELEHVRTYLELERMSDEGKIAYELDVQASNFSVPALSVQTLAENAVKHGIGKREEGGNVVVQTREHPDEFTVTISDDGVGFAQDEQSETGSGVGIANTRARLEAMCSGTLEVESEPGVGTTIVMHIPKPSGGLGI